MSRRVIAVVAAAGAALLACAASGSLGPARLADVGPAPGPVALAVGFEVFVGAAVLLLSPRGRADRRHEDMRHDAHESGAGTPDEAEAWPHDDRTAQLWHTGAFADEPVADAAERHPDPTSGEVARQFSADEARTEPIDLPRRD